MIPAGPIEWASSRMRVYWVAEALKERGHEVWAVPVNDVRRDPKSISGCDAYIWQKQVDLNTLRYLEDTRHYWDVCDPSWWWQPDGCREIAQYMTGVVASSEQLAADYNEWLGKDAAICIPDRLKLDHFHTQRQHRDVSSTRLAWCGIAANRISLWSAKANLERIVANGDSLELTIIDDRPDVPFQFSDAFPIYHTRWSLEKEVQILAGHDVALLPPYPGPWGRVKSNNKNLTALACGLPVWDGQSYAEGKELLNSPECRRGMIVNNNLTGSSIEHSARDWEALLC